MHKYVIYIYGIRLLNMVNFKYNIRFKVALKVHIVHKYVIYIYGIRLLNMVNFKYNIRFIGRS